MLTLKRITGKTEEVQEVKKVEYHSEERSGWKFRKLVVTMPDNLPAVTYENHGTFYVMNEKGNTISKYFLGPDVQI